MEGRKADNTYLTIVIPVWNREREIVRSVDSVARQIADRPVEIVVVDNASTDGTVRAVRELIRQYPFVSLVELSCHNNAAAARNAGLELANGEYVWFIDSDDWVADGAIDRIWGELKTASPDILRFDKINDAPDVKSAIANPASIELDLVRNSRNLRFCLAMGSVWNAVFSRAAIGDIRFDETFDYGEDALFTWAVTLRSHRGLYIPKPLYVYMQTPGSLTSSKTPHRFVCYMRQVERFMGLVDKAELEPSVKKDIYSDCAWRVYCHAFGCYYPDEIDDEMWQSWEHAYRVVLVDNSQRSIASRLLSWLMLKIQTRQMAYFVYRHLLNVRRRRRRLT